jgi:hypothetical protein
LDPAEEARRRRRREVHRDIGQLAGRSELAENYQVVDLGLGGAGTEAMVSVTDGNFQADCYHADAAALPGSTLDRVR